MSQIFKPKLVSIIFYEILLKQVNSAVMELLFAKSTVDYVGEGTQHQRVASEGD